MAKRKSYDLIFKLKVILQAECEGNRIVARIQNRGSGGSRKVAYRKKEINDGCSRKKRKRLRGGGQKAAHYDKEIKVALLIGPACKTVYHFAS